MKRNATKQTHTLKSLLERQQSNQNDDNSPIITLINTQQDLLNKPPILTEQNLIIEEDESPNSIKLFNALIEKEIERAAKQIEITTLELKAWIDLQLEAPSKVILNLLRTMQRFNLDPFNEEISLKKYEDDSWGVFISVDGLSKLLNQHTQFNGLHFTQSEVLIDGVPEWMECSIYRRDRVMPLTVREYFLEVKSDQSIWGKMPRRMLRHRVLQQCVKLAIGLS